MSEWVKDNGIYYYYYSDGTMATGWQELDGYWYYFYSDGSMAYDTMVEGYYVNDDGQWTKDEGSKEIIDGYGDHFYYYIGPNNGKAVTGWNRIGDTFHYYNYPYGSMKRNDTQDGFDIDNYGNIVDGTGWIEDEYSGKWYYFSDGEMQTGWIRDGSNWYYLKADGTMATGWVEDDTGWYFLDDNGCMESNDTEGGYHLDSSGKMVTGTGWKYVDSWWYYLDDIGKVVTGWLYDQGNWYYLYPQGSMAKDTTIDGYYLGDDGEWKPNDDGDSGDSQGTGDGDSTENANSGTNSNSIIENVQKLEEFAKEYYGTDNTYKINTGVMNVIRRRYNGLKWAMTAYPLDTGFIEYVRKNDDELLNFFSDNGEGASLIDPKTGGEIDFLHFAATLNTEFTSHPGPGCVSSELSDLAGWAGDLQQSIGDLQKAQINSNIGDNVDDLTNSAKEIIGANVSSFSDGDMLADVDARNIGVNLKSDSGLLLSTALQDYYSNGENSRYTTFVESYGGTDNLQKVVNGVTTSAWDPLTKDILNGNKIRGISNNQLEALNRAFMEYIENQTLNE